LFEVRPYIGNLHKYKLVQTKQTGTYYKQTIHMIQCSISFGWFAIYKVTAKHLVLPSSLQKKAKNCSLVYT